MIGIQVNVLGIKELLSKCKDLESLDWVRQANDEAADWAEETAIHMCPVDTGELQASIYLKKHQYSFELGATAKHAVFNEYGSITTPAGSPENPISAKYAGFRPFIRPAIYDTKAKYGDWVSANFKRVMHG